MSKIIAAMTPRPAIVKIDGKLYLDEWWLSYVIAHVYEYPIYRRRG